MVNQELYRSLRKYKKRLVRLSARISQEFDEECIHELRTTVKQARALLRCLGKEKKGLSASFKKMYRLSGELRDVQVLLHAMQNTGDQPAELLQWLHMQLAWLKQEWASRFNPRVVKLQGRKMQRARYRDPGPKALEHFLEKERGHLQHLLREQPLADKSIHEARKTLKRMQYVTEWFSSKGLSAAPGLPLAEIRKLGKSTGTYADRCVGISLLETCMHEMSAARSTDLLHLKDKWEKARLRQKRRIVQALHQLVP